MCWIWYHANESNTTELENFSNARKPKSAYVCARARARVCVCYRETDRQTETETESKRETNRQTERTSLEVKVDRQTDRENIPRSQSSASCLRLCQNVRHNYTHTQKLSDLLRQCTDVQASVNCFHEICTAARLIFTSLPPCNLHSLSSPRTPHRLDDTWETYLMTVKRRTNTCFARKVTYVWNNLGSGVIELMPRTR